METKDFFITIPNPCTQQWSSMAQQEHGRHCGTCNKVVLDFSQKTDTEIKDFFAHNAGKVCGQFRSDQVQQAYSVKYTKSFSALTMLFLFFMCFAVHTQSMPISRHPLPTVVNETTDELERENKDQNKTQDNNTLPGDSIVLKGRVAHQYGRIFVANATITLDNTSIVTTTDSLGRFVLKIPKTNKTYLPITISKHDFIEQKSRMNVLNKNEQLFYLAKDEDHLIMGDVIRWPIKK